MRAFIGGQICDILSVERDFAAGHRVLGIAHDHVAQRRFAGAVRAHQHVGLSSAHGQVDVVKNDLLIHGGRKACHVEEDVLVCHLLPLLISCK